MRRIAPARRAAAVKVVGPLQWIVYPALMRHTEQAWNARVSEPGDPATVARRPRPA